MTVRWYGGVGDLLFTRYKCDSAGCEKTFNKPDYYSEHGEFWGAPYIEQVPCCPHCGGDDFHEMTRDEIEEMEGEDYA